MLKVFGATGTVVLLASMLAGCGGSSATPSIAVPATIGQANAAAVRQWSREQTNVPLPGAGCFIAKYPAAVWTRVACVPAPNILFPMPQHGGMLSDIVGNGNDYTLVSRPNLTQSAIGSFDSVSGVTTVRSVGVPSFGGHGRSGPNVYSLQLNSNTFGTAACAGMAHCAGWEQFVYTNQPGAYSGGGNLIVQDWLISTTSRALKGCPKGQGWQRAGSSGCVQNGPNSMLVPNVKIGELATVTLSATAATGSSGDGTILSVGPTMYAITQSDTVTDLSQHWTGTEFNIVGNGGGSRATFNTGSSITVRIEANTGASTAPICRGNSGTTGESNNLSFISAPPSPAPQSSPSVVFSMSNAGSGGKPSCAALAASGS